MKGGVFMTLGKHKKISLDKNLVQKTKNLIDRLVNKKNLNKKEQEISDYIINFIKFRMLFLNEVDVEKLRSFNTGDQLLKYFNKQEIKALNLNIVYKDLETKKIRNERELKQLKKILSRK